MRSLFLACLVFVLLAGPARAARAVVPESTSQTEKSAAPVILLGGEPSERWAVVVGVSSYDDPSIADLRFADADAHAIAAELIESGSFSPEHVVVLTSDATSARERPIWANLDAELTRITSGVTPPAAVLFYFSGHGVAEQDDEHRRNHLLLQDTVLTEDARSPLTDTGLRARLSGAGVSSVVMLLDACRNELVPGQKGAGGGAVKPVFTDVKGLFVAYCNTFPRPCYEDAALGHGVFTYHLLEVWKDAATDLDGDGKISSLETVSLLDTRLREQTHQQLAQTVDEAAQDVVLAPTDGPQDMGPQRLSKAISQAEALGASGDIEGFLGAVRAIHELLPNWDRRIGAGQVHAIYRLEAARQALAHNDPLAAKYLLAIYSSGGDAQAASLTSLTALSPDLASLDVRVRLSAPDALGVLPLPVPFQLDPGETVYLHGASGQAWQRDLPALYQRAARGVGVCCTALVPPGASALPEDGSSLEARTYPALRRGLWIGAAASVALTGGAWLGETVSYNRYAEDPARYDGWLTTAQGASVVSGGLLIAAVVVTIRY